MLLVIDVGNSNTVIGLYRDNELVVHWRIVTTHNHTSDELRVLDENDNDYVYHANDDCRVPLREHRSIQAIQMREIVSSVYEFRVIIHKKRC